MCAEEILERIKAVLTEKVDPNSDDYYFENAWYSAQGQGELAEEILDLIEELERK